MAPSLRIVRKEADEIPLETIQTLMDQGRREAELLDELEAAAAAHDDLLVQQIGYALARVHQTAMEETKG